MSDTEPTAQTASHTLAYLRRIDLRQNQLLELVVRQQDLISHLERDMREGISVLQREVREGFSRTGRDLNEVKSDILTLENSILNRVAEHFETSDRLSEHHERLAALEAAVAR